jgi:uroporphyrinogen decarboxylase
LSGNTITLQGNLDPAKLLGPVAEIKKSVQKMITAFGKDKYIANLGHGILPNVPVENARVFVDTVKEFSY